MNISLQTTAAVSAALGIVSHLGHFIHGEHLVAAPTYFLILVLSPSIATAFLIYYASLNILAAATAVATAYTSYLVGLIGSMMIYRRFFHPLRHFPGPKAAIYSQWWLVFKTHTNCTNFRVLDALHKQYGEYVRVGPNHLSVADPDMVEPLHNSGTKFVKSMCMLLLSLYPESLQVSQVLDWDAKRKISVC